MNLKKIAKNITINNHKITDTGEVYFIADISSNHDGDIERAKDLIYLVKEAGAHAAKFQHFLANKIVSDYGFKNLGSQKSHQSQWRKSVYDTYKHYETDREWTKILIDTCHDAGIDFMTTPYDFEAIDTFSSLIPAFKIGSGDITWIEAIEKISSYEKPVFLATGASSMEDVERAVDAIIAINPNIVLMQCNTNYTAKLENFKHINLNVLKTFEKRWPGIITGLSDHTLGHTTVLGAVALGARVVEKHFTDDNSRTCPDHLFSMNPQTWKSMVDATKELMFSLGDGIKRVEDNEKETVVLQRRCIRLKDIKHKGEMIKYEDLEFLRPAPKNSLDPHQFDNIINKKLTIDLPKGACIQFADVE